MKTLVVCIGNPEGGDDAIGPYIAQELSKKTPKNYTIIDCGTAPENYTSHIKQYNPDSLIIIDAVDMHLPPGSIRRVPAEKLDTMHISTHGISLGVLVQYLHQYITDIQILGIQPETMTGPITSTVKHAADQLIRVITSHQLSSIPLLTKT